MPPTKSWNNLVAAILGLPGVGPKMAERIALHLLRRKESAEDVLISLSEARRNLARCVLCGDFVEGMPEALCARCTDPRREKNVLCVVEEIGDLQALERSRAFHGKYHVLGGVLSALDDVGPEDLRIDFLLDRVEKEGLEEIILATNPTAEGETTASYLADLLKSRGVKVSRLAYGLPSGSVIQYADEYTLAQALEGRRILS